MKGLLLVGGGKMGSAMLEGWLDQGLAPDQVNIVEPNADLAAALARDLRVAVVATPEALPEGLSPETVVLAVKPQMMDQVVPLYARYAGPDTTFLSIAAGKTIGYFQSHLGDDAAIVRAMPNTPAAIRRGITVACANAHVSAAARARCGSLLEAVGQVLWTGDEAQMDAVTALSGSGPAYVFLLTECMAKAGMAAGLPEDMARALARTTVSGAGALLDASDEDPDHLRRNVTSPGGTTAAALAVLMAEDGMEPLLKAAVAAAAARSRELAG